MRFIISIEFDIEQDEIPRILYELENLAYDLGCILIRAYQNSGHSVNVGGQIMASDVHMVRRREDDGEGN